ncbi:hypothetical protein [Flagellimonas sp.]|jgi:hypothetical protein|uniref:hypothetical protein n=1 Tax=Flagellimonas sp. TaxID=2058762 RepID=UPI003BAA79A0
MNTKSTPLNVKLQDLVLDKNNPRFAELYSGSEKEQDIIEYLLYTESADDVASAIIEANEFYPDRPLWVLKSGDKYLVKDGNRRCAAIKALKHPTKYDLDLPKTVFEELPVLLYNRESDLDTRIRQEHTSNLFKQWGRIAKALEIHRLFKSGSSTESMSELDSSPKELIKLASFYFEAVKIGGDDFKKLLRTGKGKSGGKTIIFERLFKFRNDCGYTFKRTNEISIKNQSLFESYIKAMVEYLKDNPETTSRKLDKEQKSFLSKLKPYGFDSKGKSTESSGETNATNDSSSTTSGSNDSSNSNNNDGNSGTETGSSTNSGRKSIKHKPIYKRKKIPAALEGLIQECYNLGQDNFPNAKTALTRVAFECTLKYVVENTKKSNGNILKISNHFSTAYKNNRGKPLPYTNFDVLKLKFTELIVDTGIRKAFEDFDLQRPHQIIHNYNVRAIPTDAKALCDNLIPLIEFMLQEERDLLSSLNTSKL